MGSGLYGTIRVEGILMVLGWAGYSLLWCRYKGIPRRLDNNSLYAFTLRGPIGEILKTRLRHIVLIGYGVLWADGHGWSLTLSP